MNAKQAGLIVLSVVQIVVTLLVTVAAIIIALSIVGVVSSQGMESMIGSSADNTLSSINILIAVGLISIVGYVLVIVSVFRPKMLVVMEVIVGLMLILNIVDICSAATCDQFFFAVLAELCVQIVLFVFLELIRRDFKAGNALTIDDLREMKEKRAQANEEVSA